MKIEIPTNCPSCNSILVLVNDQLFCRNKQCSAQSSAKIQHFCKVLKIKGFGPATAEKLSFESILDLFSFSESYYKEALGDTLGMKLHAEVRKAEKTATLAQVIAGLSIPLVGVTVAEKLTNNISSFSDINKGTCKQAGLGDKATNNLLTYLKSEEYATLKKLISKFKPPKRTVKSSGLTVCITGKLVDFKNRSEASKYLESLGFNVVDSVCKTTDILINEENKSSSKTKKAETLGIRVTTIKDLEKEIK